MAFPLLSYQQDAYATHPGVWELAMDSWRGLLLPEDKEELRSLGRHLFLRVVRTERRKGSSKATLIPFLQDITQQQCHHISQAWDDEGFKAPTVALTYIIIMA